MNVESQIVSSSYMPKSKSRNGEFFKLKSFICHCEERSRGDNKDNATHRSIHRKRVTKQSPLAYFIANPERGDCFVDAAGMSLINVLTPYPETRNDKMQKDVHL